MRLTPAFWTSRSESSSTTEIGEWGRGRLLAILTIAAGVVVMLLVGLVYAVYLAVSGLTGSEESAAVVATGVTHGPGEIQGQAHRDEIAAAPMLEVGEDAMFPADPAEEAAPSIDIPAGTMPGPGLVMTGFPHTLEGAIGQLAQIDVAALQAMSLRTAQEIYLNWALPGGVGPQRWWITASVQSFLSASDMGDEKDPASQVIVEPVAALVKGTDGPDWVTACVLLKVTASYRQDGEVAFGHCERMQWVGGRWVLAPGDPPAPAPSTWPGTELANAAGWRTWSTADGPTKHTTTEGALE